MENSGHHYVMVKSIKVDMIIIITHSYEFIAPPISSSPVPTYCTPLNPTLTSPLTKYCLVAPVQVAPPLPPSRYPYDPS